MSNPLPAAPAEAAPESPPPAPPPAPAPDAPLTLRQEEFCRHYAATGNAAAAARDAGYAEGSARQTGHDLLDRPAIAERVRAIRAAWQAVERAEAQILLGRLEQAWDAAVEKGSASLMIRVVKLQADLSGLDRRHAHRRAGLWPLPGEVTGAVSGEEGPRPADAGAADSGPPMGPLAEAVRRGRHRTERALALHRASRKALAKRKDFDQADWLATAQRLHATVEERRPRTPERVADGPDASNPTNHDISLHRAGLMPAEGGGRRIVRVPRPRFKAPLFGETAKEWPEDDLPDYIEYDEEEWEKFKEFRARADAAYLSEPDDSEDWRKYYTPGHDES